MTSSEKDLKMKTAKRASKIGVQAPADPFAVIDRMREAFKDVPAEEIEREVAKAVQEVREERRAERSARKPAPRGA